MNLFILLFTFFQLPGTAEYKPIHWSHVIEKINDKQYKLIWKVKVDKNYGTYSQYQIPNSTVLPIEFIFEDSSGIKFIGKNEELGNIKTVYDPVFEEKVVKITDSATFTQIIELDKPILDRKSVV